MEFCSGGSLFDMMAKNPNDRFKENQIMNIIKVSIIIKKRILYPG